MTCQDRQSEGVPVTTIVWECLHEKTLPGAGSILGCRVKEAILQRIHPNNINRDSGIELPEAWMPTIKKHYNRRTLRQRTAEGTTHRNSEDENAPITASENQPITAEHPA